MNKLNFKDDRYALVILLIGALIALMVYPQLPAKVPIHWNFQGEADNYIAKPLGAFIGILIGLMIYIGFYLLAAIDPLKDNYRRFSRNYRLIRDIMITFVVVLNLVPAAMTLGYIQNTQKVIVILASGLMIVLGNYFPTVKRNWFLGIKTPWTISNEEVWNRTHRLGGRLFVMAGIIGLFEVLFLETTYLFLIGVVVASIGSILYSYLLYKRIA